jgi:hypothetical protein
MYMLFYAYNLFYTFILVMNYINTECMLFCYPTVETISITSLSFCIYICFSYFCSSISYLYVLLFLLLSLCQPMMIFHVIRSYPSMKLLNHAIFAWDPPAELHQLLPQVLTVNRYIFLLFSTTISCYFICFLLFHWNIACRGGNGPWP